MAVDVAREIVLMSEKEREKERARSSATIEFQLVGLPEPEYTSKIVACRHDDKIVRFQLFVNSGADAFLTFYKQRDGEALGKRRIRAIVDLVTGRLMIKMREDRAQRLAVTFAGSNFSFFYTFETFLSLLTTGMSNEDHPVSCWFDILCMV